MKIKNVLSLFDGISCGQVALERAGIKYKNYFASEIDKHAIKIAQKNYPNTIQLGNICNIDHKKLPKIDLLIGGSPCQGFSFAGKKLNFKDPRSALFFEFVRLLKECKPKWFLLENVKMKKDVENKISGIINVHPIKINSALVSAQNRNRLYWTNILNITQPKDKGILLKDIIESGFVDIDKSYCVDANYFRGGNLKQYFEKGRSQLIFDKEIKSISGDIKKRKHQSQRNNNCIQTGEADLKGYDCIKRTYDINGKSPTLTTMGGGNREPKITLPDFKWRKLTPVECERLQTLPDNYTEGISNSQRYKCLGNGWTVDVIAHIFSFMVEENKKRKGLIY